ncbi:prolyl oligopeptidase family serine peptidase [Massilia sp. TS11]|uniref:S9 family peptidase n=1 Tax=Massilia sp. TS11 TaxID=2908003 RepID=UPI001EDB1EA0|nr:prolyl oligopeptidase family serine peptidase [Massilia sp. TS11]MCG2585894.1 prolyl oligopeptidase family serine peptidase [Massilia sp. TS11]
MARLLSLLLMAAACALAQADEIPKVNVPAARSLPVASFFQPAAFARAALSPSGRHVAMLYSAQDERIKLAVMDVETRVPTVVAAMAEGDIASFSWVNDRRLVFSLGDRKEAIGEWSRAPGLFAVDRDGSNLRTLITRLELPPSSGPRTVLPLWDLFLAPVGRMDTDDIFVLEPVFSGERVDAVNLLRVNTRSGAAITLPRPGPVRRWYVDPQGEPRVAMSWEKNITRIHYREPASGAWRVIAEYDSWREDAVEPVRIGPDGTLYVRARKGDKYALYPFDLKANKVADEPVVELPDFDFSGELLVTSQAVHGVAVEADRMVSAWFDPAMAALQKQVDLAFPNAENLIRQPYRAEVPYVMVFSRSDVQPGELHLLNTETRKLIKIGDLHPEIDPAKMAHKRFVRYKARDGLEIPAYLTLPRGVAPNKLPLVMLVHGGPSVRGVDWNFNREVQFLASRGYAVLEPEFRGSVGYGKAHERAGWKQWGLKMQDDIADGARWAIAQGYADPQRICIAGASYGGYSTLMGLVNDPDLYRCGVNWVGVTDIQLMYSVNWGDMGPEARAYQLPLWIGDREKDAAQLQATSPIVQAARIKAPLLLAYGGADARVPIIHGLAFRDAIRAHNPQVEWIEYPNEGHGWKLKETNIDFWSRVADFLDKHIGR